MFVDNEFTRYHLVGSLILTKNNQTLAILYPTDNFYLSEIKAIRKYKDLVWDIQGAINNSCIYDNLEISAMITLYGEKDNADFVIRQQKF